MYPGSRRQIDGIEESEADPGAYEQEPDDIAGRRRWRAMDVIWTVGPGKEAEEGSVTLTTGVG